MNFQFCIAMTLKYYQGHWKWYEWVKLYECYHHVKFDVYHVYRVGENRNVKVFATDGHSAGRPNTHHYIDLQFSSDSKMFLLHSNRHEYKSVIVTCFTCRHMIIFACFHHMVSHGRGTIWRSPSLSRSNTWPLSSSWNPSAHLALVFELQGTGCKIICGAPTTLAVKG